MPWMRLPKIWTKGTAFIVGGGPSVAKVTNEEWLQMAGRWNVLGCNVAMWKIPHGVVRYGLFGDKPFLKAFQTQVQEFMSRGGRVIDVTGRPDETKIPWIQELQSSMWRVKRLNRADNWGILLDDPKTSDPTAVCWNRSVGGCAINVAVNLGAKQIVLIGFDMQMLGKNHNFHSEYKEHYSSGSLPEPGPTHYKKHFLQPFPKIAERLKELNIPCWNTCEDSALKEFPYRPLAEFIRWPV